MFPFSEVKSPKAMTTDKIKNEQGFSLVELLIVVLVIAIIAVIAIPNMLAARRAANEGSAISSLRTLHGAQSTYQTSNGGGNYAGADSPTGNTFGLSQLSSVSLIDPVLGTGTKSGYNFVGSITLAGVGTPATFFFSANPVSSSGVLQSGTRRYAVTQMGFIGADISSLMTPFDRATAPTAQPLN